jgi:hypothetical protein
MSQEKQAIFQRLLPVAVGLYEETAELAQGDGDLQLWYNRGYADGMAQTMRQAGFSRELQAAGLPDCLSIGQGEKFLPWGKAYGHGLEMGEGETREVLAAAES